MHATYNHQSTYVCAGFEFRVEDCLSLVVDEERVHGSPLVLGEEVLQLIQGRIDPNHTNCPEILFFP